MRNLLLSAAIGDISGMPYEHNRTKDYNAVDLQHPKSDYTDDTVMTFACAEAMLYDDDIAMCMRRRGNADVWRGYGTNFANWLFAKLTEPAYYSYGNGSAMRVSSAGFMAYAYYREMPEELIAHAKSELPQWMLDLNDEFDVYCATIHRD